MRSSCVRFMRKLLRVSHSRLSRWRHSGLSKTGKRVLLRELNLAGRQGFEPRYRGPESGSRVSVRFDRLRFPRFLATTRRFGPVRLARLPCSLSHPVSNRCLQSRLSRFRNHRTDAFGWGRRGHGLDVSPEAIRRTAHRRFMTPELYAASDLAGRNGRLNTYRSIAITRLLQAPNV